MNKNQTGNQNNISLGLIEDQLYYKPCHMLDHKILNPYDRQLRAQIEMVARMKLMLSHNQLTNVVSSIRDGTKRALRIGGHIRNRIVPYE